MAKKRESSSSSQATRVTRHGVHNTESVLTAGAIASLVVDYGLPSDWSYRTPGALDRAKRPPAGYITVYEHYLRGLCYPMHCTLYALVNALRVPVARLHPNALLYLVSMSPKAGFHFRGTYPDSVKGWKEHFFFLQKPPDSELSGVWGPISGYFQEKSPAEDAVEAAELISAIKSEEAKFSVQDDEEEEASLKRLREAGGTSTRRSKRQAAGLPVHEACEVESQPAGSPLTRSIAEASADAIPEAKDDVVILEDPEGSLPVAPVLTPEARGPVEPTVIFVEPLSEFRAFEGAAPSPEEGVASAADQVQASERAAGTSSW
ncbi:hypothetical protein Nepgr_025060 [Nepenthes gracilis]|uniref:Uncharacterized protein n=1 Tax=Nepenthes gracilis TaxID=150966 RepID=A0AAD3XZ71_NEPGR|nr:hypothetical protein Nepgr_025060 [Nepenthes gracilis]